MSRSNPTLTNPAEHFFEWAGSKGLLQWYDKATQKTIQVRLPFEFLVLDQLSTIVGYSKLDKSGFWSNEVRNTKKDELFVRTKHGPFEAGLYENLTQTMKKNGKFCKSVYIAHKGPEDKWIIGCFKASGSALSAWIEFSKRHAVETGKVVVTRGDKQEAPTGEFRPPVFTYEKSIGGEDAEAMRLDKELQIYLNQYLSAPKVDEDAQGIDESELATPEQAADFELATPEQAADFEERKAANKKELLPTKPDIVYDDVDDTPINLDDIPF